jgi:hypothetical protein
VILGVLWAAVFAACAAQAAAVTHAQRIDAARAIERARYAFVIGTKPPFDERYTKAFFVTQLKEQEERERVLRQAFGIVITPKDLAREFERIEKSTKAPDQWEAMKAAVSNDRRLLQEVVCRPLLVDQILRAKFAFDQRIHAAQHEAARRARGEFLAGREPAGAKSLTIERRANASEWTDADVERAKVEASVPRVLAPPADPAGVTPVLLEPEARAALEKELLQPGDVSTILEYPDRFEVYRLQASTPDSWRVDAVRFAKENFDLWYEEARRKLLSR